jgi:hypothetical protein
VISELTCLGVCGKEMLPVSSLACCCPGQAGAVALVSFATKQCHSQSVVTPPAWHWTSPAYLSLPASVGPVGPAAWEEPSAHLTVGSGLRPLSTQDSAQVTHSQPPHLPWVFVESLPFPPHLQLSSTHVPPSLTRLGHRCLGLGRRACCLEG